MIDITPINGLDSGQAHMDAKNAISQTEGTIRQELNSLDRRGKAEFLAGHLQTTFINQMLTAMRKATPEGGLVGVDRGAKMYREMLDREYARLAGKQIDASFHEALVRQILDGMGGVAGNEQGSSTEKEGRGEDVRI